MIESIANWGNYPRVVSNVSYYSFEEQLPGLTSSIQSYIPRGNGRCYGDASLAGNTLSCLRADNILRFDQQLGLFECQSGVTLDQILKVIVPCGWFLPVTPGTKFITVGGAVASDVHGKNHHVHGSFSNHVVELDVFTGQGQSITCSRHSNEDLFEATFGGMGLTGLITRVLFRLIKIETSYIAQKQIKARNIDHILDLFEEYNSYTYSVAWIDCIKGGASLGRSILMLGEHALVNQVNLDKGASLLGYSKSREIVLPFFLPEFVLNKFSVRLFNELFYHKGLKSEMSNIIPYEPFFYPLDKVLDWNKGYGKSGFLQYQFVLPPEEKKGLKVILQRIGEKGWGSFLAVLKKFGKQESLIGFPKEGYTLALDFPVRRGLFEFLDELDALVVKFGGRLYMSKDARMSKEVLEAGYDGLNAFKNIVGRYDPQSRVRSSLSDRLQLK